MKTGIDPEQKATDMKFTRLLQSLSLVLVLVSGAAAYELDFDYNGAVRTGIEGGRETWKKKDGTVIVKAPDREEAVLRDETRIVRFSNGNREVYAPDGVVIHIRFDGETRYRYPDGTQKVLCMDGLTPYGLSIKDHSKVIRRRGFTVEVVYSSRLSDNVLERGVKKFYDELVAQITRRVYAGRVPNMRMRVVISNCRFCKTGYCRRKNRKEVTVTSFLGDKKDRELSIRHDDILVNSLCHDEASRAAERLLAGRVRQ